MTKPAEIRWIELDMETNRQPGSFHLGKVVHASSGRLIHGNAVSLREACELFLDTTIIVKIG